MSPIAFEICVIFLLTVINGLFAMSEVALLSARKIRLHLADHGNARAGAALILLEDPNNFLSIVQIGVTLVGVLSGAFGRATIAAKIASYLTQYPIIRPYGETIGISVVFLPSRTFL
jgi:magnesium and cobalt exporter, CNNM family